MLSFNRLDNRDAEGDQSEPMNTKFVGDLNYLLTIKIFSSLLVFLGITSILVQVFLILMSGSVVDILNVNGDSSVKFIGLFWFIGRDIWVGVAYLTVGSLGIAAVLQRKKSLLVATIVMSTLVIFISLTAALLPWLAVADIIGGTQLYFNYRCSGRFGCDVVFGSVQIAFFICHILAFSCSIGLTILTSVICSSSAESHKLISNSDKVVAMNDQESLLL